MIPHFATLKVAKKTGSGRCPWDLYIYASCARGGTGTHTTYTISAWAFFVAYPCTIGNAKAWNRGISSRYSSHAFFVVNLLEGNEGEAI